MAVEDRARVRKQVLDDLAHGKVNTFDFKVRPGQLEYAKPNVAQLTQGAKNLAAKLRVPVRLTEQHGADSKLIARLETLAESKDARENLLLVDLLREHAAAVARTNKPWDASSAAPLRAGADRRGPQALGPYRETTMAPLVSVSPTSLQQMHVPMDLVYNIAARLPSNTPPAVLDNAIRVNARFNLSDEEKALLFPYIVAAVRAIWRQNDRMTHQLEGGWLRRLLTDPGCRIVKLSALLATGLCISHRLGM